MVVTLLWCRDRLRFGRRLMLVTPCGYVWRRTLLGWWLPGMVTCVRLWSLMRCVCGLSRWLGGLVRFVRSCRWLLCSAGMVSLWNFRLSFIGLLTALLGMWGIVFWCLLTLRVILWFSVFLLMTLRCGCRYLRRCVIGLWKCGLRLMCRIVVMTRLCLRFVLLICVLVLCGRGLCRRRR